MSTHAIRERAWNRRTALLVVALAALILASPTSTRAAASGVTDIDINIPDIVILHYFSSVDVTLTGGALGNWLASQAGDSSVDEGPVVPAAGGFDHDLGIVPSTLAGGDPAAALLLLRNAWAVRSISLVATTNTQLTISNTDDTLDHDTTAAFITITGVAVDDGTSNGASISFAAPGLANPVTGDVELTLDLTEATNAGLYEDGVFTLTATNI